MTPAKMNKNDYESIIDNDDDNNFSTSTSYLKEEELNDIQDSTMWKGALAALTLFGALFIMVSGSSSVAPPTLSQLSLSSKPTPSSSSRFHRLKKSSHSYLSKDEIEMELELEDELVLDYDAVTPGHPYAEIKAETLYFEQLVDHVYDDGTYQQRYYTRDEYFGGPGSPIFVVLGGEDSLDDLLYTWVVNDLAAEFGAYAMAIEHRFYGKSMPVVRENSSTAEFEWLIQLPQVLKDFVRLIQYKREELGCNLEDRTSKDYCPVMTVGASYPGFLSMLIRMAYPREIDIGYAASAPIYTYAHSVSTEAYFDKITSVAETASPGCADAVRNTLLDLGGWLTTGNVSVKDAAEQLGICPDTIPSYIVDGSVLSTELNMIVATHFAEYNMFYYPPTPETDLVEGCQLFQRTNLTKQEKIAQFLWMYDFDLDRECFDLVSELPDGGKNARITASDWSGVGGDDSSYSWDFQCCLLAPSVGFSKNSMFPERPWSMGWLTNHCQSRFGLTPPPPEVIIETFGLQPDNLREHVSRVIFTNGLNDGWQVASVQIPFNENVKVFNIKSGAHHSDLGQQHGQDTQEMLEVHAEIALVVREWLEDSRRQV